MADNQQPSSEFRSCRKCGKTKAIDEFSIYDKQRGWRRHDCIECRRQYQTAWSRGEIDVTSDDLHRTCKVCGITKAIEDFAVVYARNSRGKLYRQHTCLDCFRAHSAAKERRRRKEKPESYRVARQKSNAENGERTRERRRIWNAGLRDVVFEAYGGYRCVCCGETEHSMLTLDHINNDGGKHRKSEPAMRWAKHLYAWLIKQGFPKILQVLCYNCNISKYRCGGICEHKLQEGSTTSPKGRRAKRLEMPRVSKRS